MGSSDRSPVCRVLSSHHQIWSWPGTNWRQFRSNTFKLQFSTFYEGRINLYHAVCPSNCLEEYVEMSLSISAWWQELFMFDVLFTIISCLCPKWLFSLQYCLALSRCSTQCTAASWVINLAVNTLWPHSVSVLWWQTTSHHQAVGITQAGQGSVDLSRKSLD